MTTTASGRSPDGSGYSAEPEPSCTVSAVPVSIPNALPNATYFSCRICHGSRVAFGETCRSCADPDPAIVRFALERLTPDQMAFLRTYGHTLAEQPVAEYPHDIQMFVSADDGIWDEEFDGWIVPHTEHWFASGHLKFGPAGNASFVRLNPLGLVLRECLMAGADCNVPHYVPAIAIETRQGGDVKQAPSRSDESAAIAQKEAR